MADEGRWCARCDCQGLHGSVAECLAALERNARAWRREADGYREDARYADGQADGCDGRAAALRQAEEVTHAC